MEATNENATHKLVLWDDDVNVTIYVTQSIIQVLGISEEDAQTLMLEDHNTGSTVVKTGEFDELNILMNKFYIRNLKATIEPIV